MNEGWTAVSDKSRREILDLLRKRDMSAGEIADNFNISKPSISHHLNILKNAGLVEFEKKGQSLIYSINTTVFQDIMTFALKFTKEEDSDEQKI